MTQYLISVYQPESDQPPDPEMLERVMHDLDAVNDEIKAAGAWVFAGGLNFPSTATVARLEDGEVLLTDGPFVESKEYLGGSRSSGPPTSTRRALTENAAERAFLSSAAKRASR
jgi:hypothetical protein